MFAVFASKANFDDPLASIVVGERPEPTVPEGWVRVKVSHASLNRHDLFTLRGITAHEDPITFPMILGNDGAGVLDDGTEVIIYPVMGSPDWRGDETLDCGLAHLQRTGAGHFCRLRSGPSPQCYSSALRDSAVDASVLGTAWLTAYRALFTKSNLVPGETLLVQGASGGMSTALIQLGRAAGFEVWATSRSVKGRELAEKLGAHRTFDSNDKLPRRVQAVVDNIGPASWAHSMASIARGGTIVITGVTTGLEVTLPLLPMLAEQIMVCGSIMGTLADMQNMISFVVAAGIKPEIGQVLPMECAEEALRAMWEGKTHGKTVFTR